MRTGHGTQVGAARGQDAVHMVGLTDGPHGDGGDAGFLANAVGKRGLVHAAIGGFL